MELIDQHTKKIMEESKVRARDAGLKFDNETLEYLVTNREMTELSPKGMIPTMYSYWVDDLQTIKGLKEYELYPHNAYETVINTRPALSFYNDNNPDWLNVMIFYHVIGHIDFMQNNKYFRNTWDDDFCGQALADKRLIANLRIEHGRWVDYVIEFARGVDNICNYYDKLDSYDRKNIKRTTKTEYFFDVFLQKVKKVQDPIYLKEIDRHNNIIDRVKDKRKVEKIFTEEVSAEYPEFAASYKKYIKDIAEKPADLMQFVMKNSPFLQREENQWMKLVMEVVRNTALYFEPQRRTKIMNEGWASYWHNRLFIADDRIKGHEVDYAKINSFVTALPKVGLNPYATGVRMFEFIEDSASKGKYCWEFDKLQDREARKHYANSEARMDDYMFYVRDNYCDFTFINKFINQDFTDKNKLVTIGERLNPIKWVKEYYIKSKKAEDYKEFLLSKLVHPPKIDFEKLPYSGTLILTHKWEGYPLYSELIPSVLTGLEFLWGSDVGLHTHEWEQKGKGFEPKEILYMASGKKVTKS